MSRTKSSEPTNSKPKLNLVSSNNKTSKHSPESVIQYLTNPNHKPYKPSFSDTQQEKLDEFSLDILDMLVNMQGTVESLMVCYEYENRHNLCMGLLKLQEGYERILEGRRYLNEVTFHDTIKPVPTTKKEIKKAIKAAIDGLQDDLD
jgi:hypothetical protein